MIDLNVIAITIARACTDDNAVGHAQYIGATRSYKIQPVVPGALTRERVGTVAILRGNPAFANWPS
jgi:hypothetical protein